MAFILENRMQNNFLPSCIEDYVAKDDPVRVYDAFVDALDLLSLGISLSPQSNADEYHPKSLLKLLLYGYSYGIRSSRKLERACYHNVAFQWLMGGQKPDYRTIARFRSKYKEPIKQVLKQCVAICMDLKLIEGNVLFTDGSKFRANASMNNQWTQEKCEKYLKKVHEHIDRLVDESETIDQQEDREGAMIKLHKKIENKAKLVQKIQGVMKRLKESDKTSINSTDQDSVKAKSRQGTHASYNVQINIDQQHGLIVHGEAVSQNNDCNQLRDQLEKSSQNMRKRPKISCADAGYNSLKDLVKIDRNIRLILPSTKQVQKERGVALKPFDKDRFIYDSAKDEYICPEQKRLKFIGMDKKPGIRIYQAKKEECLICKHYHVCTTNKLGRRIIRLAQERLKEKLESYYKSSKGQEIYRQRKEKAEHPFGHFKRNLGAGQFMLRGKTKVDAEVSILSTCFNIARMMTIIGVPKLIECL